MQTLLVSCLEMYHKLANQTTIKQNTEAHWGQNLAKSGSFCNQHQPLQIASQGAISLHVLDLLMSNFYIKTPYSNLPTRVPFFVKKNSSLSMSDPHPITSPTPYVSPNCTPWSPFMNSLPSSPWYAHDPFSHPGIPLYDETPWQSPTPISLELVRAI